VSHSFNLYKTGTEAEAEDLEFQTNLGYIASLCLKNKTNKQKNSWAPMAYVCNPRYSESRDQEDCGSRPDWVKK
jgi:hypothetical protein